MMGHLPAFEWLLTRVHFGRCGSGGLEDASSSRESKATHFEHSGRNNGPATVKARRREREYWPVVNIWGQILS